MTCKYFLPVCELSFQFLDGTICSTKFFDLIKFNSSVFSFGVYAFVVIYKKILPNVGS